jgi:hypothetical protein
MSYDVRMLESVDVLPGARRSLRRAAHLQCELVSTFWDEPVPHLATDLSEHGLWVRTLFPLAVGEHLFVFFRPPRSDRETLVTAVVRRVELCRRASDPGSSGMGLEFLDISEAEREQLRVALLGVPPPLKRSGGHRAKRDLVWVERLLTWEEDLGDRVNTFEVSEHIGVVTDEDFAIAPLAEPLRVAS